MEQENTALVQISKAEQMLQCADEINDILTLRDMGAATHLMLSAQGFSEAAQKAKIFQLKAERKAGMWLAENVSPQSAWLQDATTAVGLPEGVDKYESSRWQLEAKVPEEKFNEWVDENLKNGWEVTAGGLRAYAKNLNKEGGAHVSHNSGENEWYTPPDIINAARKVMGRIDLDPASSPVANKIVKATVFYDKEDDGLQQFWAGKVWMNPPYSSDLIGLFTQKFAEHVKNGDISEGIVLVNNATETAWFQDLLDEATSVCLPRGRVKFIDKYGLPSGAPLQGQVVLYFGDDPDEFDIHFSGFGKILNVA